MNRDRKRILVVDNDPDIQDVTRIILESMGHHEVVTSCKTELSLKLENHVPDLILLDFGLKGWDTREICKHLKAGEKTKNLPLLLFSTRLDIEKIYHTIGADDFLMKPFDVSKLLEKVTRWTSTATPVLLN